MVALILGMPGVVGFAENFEDDTEGLEPTHSQYTYAEVNVQGDYDDVVSSTGTDVDGLSYLITPTLTTDIGGGNFDLVDSTQVENLSFIFEQTAGDGSNQGTCQVILYDEDYGGSGLAGTGNNIFSITSVDTGAQAFWQIGTSGGSNQTTVQSDAGAGPVEVNVLFDWAAETFDVSLNGGEYVVNDFDFSGAVSDAAHGLQVSGGSGSSSAVGAACSMDNVLLDATFGDAPQPPSGLSAVVVDADTTTEPADNGVVELRWPVSEDDPNQDQGDFAYEVYVDGIFVGDDAATAADGDGVRFNSVEIGGGASVGSSFAFAIKARNTTTDQRSVFSCSVSVDTSILGDSDNCGTGAPGGTGALDFTTETDTAAGLALFCSDLMGDSEASKFLCGLILVVIVFMGVGAAFAAMAGAPGMPAVIAGSVGAFGMMIFLVVAQIWSLGAAAIIILMSTGVALSLMRRLFFGGGGSGG